MWCRNMTKDQQAMFQIDAGDQELPLDNGFPPMKAYDYMMEKGELELIPQNIPNN